MGRDRKSVYLSQGRRGGERQKVCLSIPGEEGWGEIGLFVCLSQGKRGDER